MTVDHKIIEDCKSGKRRAQGKLYNLFSGVMLGVCLRYSSDRAEAEDILQEGFIKVFSKLNQLKNNDALEGWVRRIMVNTAINHCNKKKIHFDSIEDDAHYLSDEKEESYQPVDPDVLMEMIQKLPEGYRIVLNLYVFEGFSHKEIAAKLRIAENTSKTQLFKARNKLKKMVQENNLINQNLVDHDARI